MNVIDSNLGTAGPIVAWIRIILGLVVEVIVVAMMLRSVFIFGIDYMTVVYLYFPEENEFQDHEIYSALRHPMYAGLLTIGLTGILEIFDLYSIIFYLMLLFWFYVPVHFVEEPELVKRFSDSYVTYRKRTPAFFVSPAKLGAFFRFLLARAPRHAASS
jgi:protein-S-isoprenylcysteine O-methyltransferase Ste14